MDRKFTVAELIDALKESPGTYQVLLCADDVLPPSPWTDKFQVDIDDAQRVVRLNTELMS